MTANDLFRTIQIANKRETGKLNYKFISSHVANYFSFANGEIILKTPTYIVYDSPYREDITSPPFASQIRPHFCGLFEECGPAKFTDDFREYKAGKNFRKCDRIYRVKIGISGDTCLYRKLFKTLIESADKTFSHMVHLHGSDIFAPAYDYNINYSDSIRVIVAPCIVPDWES